MPKYVTFVSLLCMICLAILLITTDPSQLSSKFLLLPFVLLFLILWTLISFCLTKFGVGWKRSRRLATTPAAVPIGLLLLQSIGQLSVWDVIIIIILASTTHFYVSRIKTATPNG